MDFFYCALEHIILQPQFEDIDDVYSCKKTHIDYMTTMADELENRELCTACFFERSATRYFIQVYYQ